VVQREFKDSRTRRGLMAYVPVSDSYWPWYAASETCDPWRVTETWDIKREDWSKLMEQGSWASIQAPANVKAALRAPTPGLCASAYYSSIRGMSGFQLYETGSAPIESLLMAIVLLTHRDSATKPLSCRTRSGT
jgi:hypothetical protein